VWLHGMPGSRGLRHVGDGYLTHRLCVYTYDRPGYGRSTRMPGRRVADVAADVRAIADAVGLDRFAVGGVSAGAPTALAAAALLPDRVTRCAVVVPPAPLIAEGLDYWAGMGEEERRSWMRVTQGGEPQQTEAQETWDWVRSGMPGLDDLEEEDLAMFTAAMREAFLQGRAGHLDDGTSLSRDWGFRLEDVAAPTQVMVALDDASCPPAHGEWLVRRLPKAELKRVEGGHLGPRDEPEMQLMAWLGHGPGT
jgi:pimeloyl-ACP methyl ester carboxylesterase